MLLEPVDVEGEAIEASEFAAVTLFMVACEVELPLLPPGVETDCAEAHKTTAKGMVRKGVDRFNQCIRHIQAEQLGSSTEPFHPHPTPDYA